MIVVSLTSGGGRLTKVLQINVVENVDWCGVVGWGSWSWPRPQASADTFATRAPVGQTAMQRRHAAQVSAAVVSGFVSK